MNGLVRDFGLSMEITIYAILATGANEYSEVLEFVFEPDEETGLMQHVYV